MNTLIRAITRHLVVSIAVAALIGATSGCGFFYKIKAKDKLNNGAREYNAGQYARAEELFKQAMELNPELTVAYLFYAAAIRAQFLPGSPDPDNVRIGERAVKAYEDVLKVAERTNDHNAIDQAYAFIAHLYEGLGKPELHREWLLKRAKLPNQREETVRDTYYSLGVALWNELNSITARWADQKRTETNPFGNEPIAYMRSDMPAEDRQRAEQAYREGMEFIEQALQLDPNYANAYSYKGLLYYYRAKLDSDPQRRRELLKQWKEAVDKFQELNQKQAELAAQQQKEKEQKEGEASK